MRNYERLSILVSLVVLGLAFSLIVALPTRIFQGSFLGSPVAIVINGQLFMAGLLTALTAIGTDYALREHPGYEATAGYAFLFWIIPCMVTLAAALSLQWLVSDLRLWAAGLILTGAALSLVIVAEYRTIDPKDPAYTPARLGLNLVVYLSALVLFAGIYSAKLRSLLSATAMVVLAGLLALALLRAERRMTLHTWLYAAICALILGEATWALNYWGVSALAGGSLLLLAFYFFTGLAQQQLLGRFSRAILLEFLFVVGFGLGVLISQTSLRW
ncbi:MAG: hypothetical protein M5U01_04650 [Ardenticatenaceae bacterium]|nr:hypothetical protein [Ardenticatenaceae bacterium]